MIPVPDPLVLARYVDATADLADDDLVVRATADNPFYCPRRSKLIVAEHENERADYTCVERLSYVVPEVMTAGALRRMASLAWSAECREHVVHRLECAPLLIVRHAIPPLPRPPARPNVFPPRRAAGTSSRSRDDGRWPWRRVRSGVVRFPSGS